MKKLSLVSTIVFLLVASAELSFSQEEHSQLVGLYFLRHHGLENRYVEEVFPLALIRKGEYQQAAGWEGTGFSIYSFEQGRLQRKFTGGGYGC